MSRGSFLLNMKAQGYLEINKKITIDPNQRVFEIQTEALNQNYNTLRVNAIDCLTQEAIQGVYFEIQREKDQLPEEGLSDEFGNYNFDITNTGTYIIKA